VGSQSSPLQKAILGNGWSRGPFRGKGLLKIPSTWPLGNLAPWPIHGSDHGQRGKGKNGDQPFLALETKERARRVVLLEGRKKKEKCGTLWRLEGQCP